MSSKILVVGAGGIGCELLKLLCVTNETDIVVIDYDTIETTNLNRQFLFLKSDTKKSKAITASKVYKRCGNMNIVGINSSIYNYGTSFFEQFGVVYNCLDNDKARSYVNKMCCYSKTVLIDGGSAGYLGQSMYIDFKKECFDCLPFKYPKEFPVCTIHGIPTEFEHCIAWAMENILDLKDELVVYMRRHKHEKKIRPSSALLWYKGVQEIVEGDRIRDFANDRHAIVRLAEVILKPSLSKSGDLDTKDSHVLERIYHLAVLRANRYGIPKMDLMTVESIVGDIIPSVCTTNACVASLMLISHKTKMNYFLVRHQKVVTKAEPSEKNPKCEICGIPMYALVLNPKCTVRELIHFLEKYIGTAISIYSTAELLYDASLLNCIDDILQVEARTLLTAETTNRKYRLFIEDVNGKEIKMR